MREYRIEFSPFQFLSYLKMECEIRLNQHGRLKVSGLIEDRRVEEYEKLVVAETWVSASLVGENEESKIFFMGILTNFEIQRENGDSILYLEIHTGSCILDIKKHTRSFQEDDFLYADVINTCINPAGGKAIMLERKDMPTGRFLLQYHETDWDFALRLAGYAETVLIPDTETPGKKFYVGYRKNQTVEEIKSDHYRQINDLREWEEKKERGMKLAPADSLKYIVTAREVYGLGESVMFQDQIMIVAERLSHLEGSELYHEYSLLSQRSGYVVPAQHSTIKGVSLRAKVTKVERAKVQVQIIEDENKEHCKARWFDYATVYSTPDGTGWYCMPEVGDLVRLAFPDDKEENAYVVSCVHLETAQGRSNPNNKSWKNIHKKEVLFTPDSLVLHNNDGLILELSDNKGIRIVSDKAIHIQAAEEVSISSAGASISMNAEDTVLMSQGCAKIEMKDAIKISGGKVYMN